MPLPKRGFGYGPCLPRRLIAALLATAVLASGCRIDLSVSTRAEAGLLTPTVPTALAPASLANATYSSVMLEGARVTLADGGLHDAERGITFTMLAEPIAHGVVDGAPVAAVLLAESGGGSGTFISLVLFGIEADRAVMLAATMLGDRPRVKHLGISDDGAVLVQMVQVGANDAFCCPATPMSVTYAYTDGELVLRELWAATIDVEGYAERANTFIPRATPYDRSEPAGGQGEPAHFAWTFDANTDLDLARAHVARTGYVAVYSVADYQAAWDDAGDPFVADTLAALEGLLEQRPDDPPAPLPLLPLHNGVNDFAARVAYLELSDGGCGVRFVGRFAQDAAPLANNQLRYLFQGFSADGAALVVASLPITTTALPDGNGLTVHDPGIAGHDIDAHLEHWRSIFNEPQPAAFEPALEKLDALLQSVDVTTASAADRHSVTCR